SCAALAQHDLLSLHDALPISAGDEGAVVQVRPVLDQGVAGLDCTSQQGGGGALEGGVVVAVQSDAPGSAGRVGTYEAVAGPVVRSEEHTSELQSRENLVCRLL